MKTCDLIIRLSSPVNLQDKIIVVNMDPLSLQLTLFFFMLVEKVHSMPQLKPY